MEKIVIGSDHAGFLLKNKIIPYLMAKGYEVIDEGVFDENPSDYPDIAKKVALTINSQNIKFGILICGTGIGMSIAANKFKNIRAALCKDEFTAEMSRLHNNSNILVLGARVTEQELIFKIIDKWLETPFEGGRHQRRIDKITEFENI